jgi:putative proteasome-type protease
MTYCVGLRLNRGLVFMSDTRTNAGVDNISTFRKMYTWSKPGERLITLLSAGNLATTQTVVSMLEEHTKAAEDRQPGHHGSAVDVSGVARLVGETVRDVIKTASDGGAPEPGGLQRHLHSRRTDRRRRHAHVPDLSGRQFHRGDR